MTSQTYDAQSVPARKLEARVRKFRGKLFVANASLAFELDEVAELIFRSVDGVATLQQIGEKVAAEYDISVAEAVSDCAELLAQLTENGMVEWPAVSSHQ
ncbi:PqqD family protein [Kitasatospora sp. NPDC048540]|uniref:PqqD family protein n=1 Tax=unclassified Kitasatospora TaxID=2633591 RepID=UPI00053B2C5F|nr:PqqD family protein [Kitasatospora sp. MBT63]